MLRFMLHFMLRFAAFPCKKRSKTQQKLLPEKI